jgi:hypothetical protein
MRELFSDYILSADQLRAIGNVVVETTYLEIYVEQVIWRLAGMEKESGKFFTDQTRIAARLELLSSLGKPRLKGTKLARFTALVSDIKIETEHRNTIVHGVWVTAKISLAELLGNDWKERKPAFANKRRLHKPPLKFSAVKVRETAERISTLSKELTLFCEEEWPSP